MEKQNLMLGGSNGTARGKSIHQGHRRRLRKKAEIGGLFSLPLHELLELLLYPCLPVRNVNRIAHELAWELGSLGSVLQAEAVQLTQIKGLSWRTVHHFRALRTVLRAYCRMKFADRPRLDAPRRMAEFVETTQLPDSALSVSLLALTRSGHLLFRTLIPRCEWSAGWPSRRIIKMLLGSAARSAVLVYVPVAPLGKEVGVEVFVRGMSRWLLNRSIAVHGVALHFADGANLPADGGAVRALDVPSENVNC